MFRLCLLALGMKLPRRPGKSCLGSVVYMRNCAYQHLDVQKTEYIYVLNTSSDMSLPPSSISTVFRCRNSGAYMKIRGGERRGFRVAIKIHGRDKDSFSKRITRILCGGDPPQTKTQHASPTLDPGPFLLRTPRTKSSS